MVQMGVNTKTVVITIHELLSRRCRVSIVSSPAKLLYNERDSRLSSGRLRLIYFETHPDTGDIEGIKRNTAIEKGKPAQVYK